MLKFTRKLDYAILAMAHLCAEGIGQALSARSLAERSRVPAAILANILKDLNRAGLVSSSRGAHGGYGLSRDPQQLTVGEVIRAVEGPVRLVECVVLEGDHADHASGCELDPGCPLKSPLQRVHERLHNVLDEMTFAELIAEGSFVPASP